MSTAKGIICLFQAQSLDEIQVHPGHCYFWGRHGPMRIAWRRSQHWPWSRGLETLKDHGSSKIKNGGNIDIMSAVNKLIFSLFKEIQNMWKLLGQDDSVGLKSRSMTGNLHLASSGGDIKIWKVPEVNLVKSFSPHSQPVGSLCWSPNSIL